MGAQAVLNALDAAGVTLTLEGQHIRARPTEALTEPLRGLIRRNRGELVELLGRPSGAQPTSLRASFDIVTSAFGCTGAEIEEAWAAALRDVPAAEAALHADAALIRAGWKPLEERAGVFRARLAAAP